MDLHLCGCLPPLHPAACHGTGASDCLQSVISRGYSTSEDDEAEPSEMAAPLPPPDGEGGIPHRWRVVIMMAAAFVLCNMDKVHGHRYMFERRCVRVHEACLAATARMLRL